MLVPVEIRQLECFVAVAEELSFTRAAARLHVVQPAVSATIASLERELATELLHRTSRRVQMTEAGRALLPKARATLDAAREAIDAVDEAGGVVAGTLRVGIMNSLGVIDLAALLGDYHRAYPAVAVHLVTTASGEGAHGLIDGLTEGRLDVAFVSIPGDPPVTVELQHLTSVPLELVVPACHPFAERSELSITELAGEAFVDFPVGCGNRAVTDRAFLAAGVSREVAIEITAVQTGADYVRNGLGVALLPAVAADDYDDLATLPIVDAELDWPIALATSTKRTLTAATRAFRDFVSEASLTASLA